MLSFSIIFLLSTILIEGKVRERTVVITRVGPCKGFENLTITVDEFEIMQKSKGNYYLSGAVEATEELPPDLKGFVAAIGVKQCDDYKVRSTCRPFFNELKMTNACEMLKNENIEGWRQMKEVIQPKLECPLKKEKYVIKNLLVPNSLLKITSYALRKLATLVGVTYELRGVEISSDPHGAFVCANHQAAFDMLTKINMTEYFVRFTAVAKQEMFWVLPFGIPAYLAGVVFIDRKSKTAFDKLEQAANVILKKKVKIIIYPEGTRNLTDQPLLPFKKGAFISAIKAQIPIIPTVFSKYYFLDDKNKIFENGHVIISVLPAIKTKGMNMDNLDELVERTRNLMVDEVLKLDKEVKENKEKWATEKRPRMTVVEHHVKAE